MIVNRMEIIEAGINNFDFITLTFFVALFINAPIIERTITPKTNNEDQLVSLINNG